MAVSVFADAQPLKHKRHHIVGASSLDGLTEIETMMQLPPYFPIPDSIEQTMALRNVIEDAIQELPETQRWAFNGYYIERMSLANLGRDAVNEFGRPKGYCKTHVARLRDQASSKLAAKLADHPLVAPRLN